MSRKRSHAFLETGQVPEAPSDGAEEEAGGFPELDTDEELVCSVSDITEHLGRNMTALLEAALAEIRKLVGVRIRVLKMELREKNEEVALLRARLQVAERDVGAVARELVVPELERRSEQKKGKTGVPVVKKEKINAICDYLMKDKNSRSCGAEVDGEQLSPSPAEWTDSGVTGGGGAGGAGGEPGTDAGADDLFSILPSSSKRLYDYEWMTGVELNSDFKGEHEAKCESITVAPEADEEDDDSEGGRGGMGLVSGEPSASFSLDAHASSGEDGSPVGDGMDRLDPGQHFSSHTFICPFCGTLCPDSSYLEEHIKLMHRDESIQAMQSTSSGSRGEGAEGNRGRVAGGSGPRERKVKGGYECVECGRHFNYLGNLRQHQRIHTGEKPFVCPECGERFRHAARLKSHKLSHSGAQSPFPCPQCGKGFSVLSGLKRHQRVHTGESPYGCPQCGRRFKELGNLYTHMRIHSGATPYACYQCGRSFRHLGTFKSHRCTPATQLASGHAPAWVQDDKVHTG